MSSPAVPARRGDIEGMRAIAVVLVVVYHTGAGWLGGGFVGVDVFFVISGYLITKLLIDEADHFGSISLRNFWARRMRRNQLITNGASQTIHAVKSGHEGGGGSSIDLSEGK